MIASHPGGPENREISILATTDAYSHKSPKPLWRTRIA